MPLIFVAALCTLASPITVKVRAQSLAQLLPVLSQKVGRPLTVQPTLAREQLVIDAENVDPNALLARVAEVTHAQWVEEAGEYRLRRSAEAERALERDERAFHTENLRRQWVQATRNPYDVQKAARTLLDGLRNRDVEPPEGEHTGPEPQPPVERYLPDLLLGLPSETLAGLEDGRGVVYSNRPLGSQRPLPAALRSTVERLFRDHQTFTSVIGPHADEEFPDAPPTRIVLSAEAVRLYPGSLRLLAQVVLRDRTNRPIATASLNEYSSYPALPRLAEPQRIPPIRLNPVAEEWESIRGQLRLNPGTRSVAQPVTQDLREAVLNPERDGRLAQTWSEALFALADHESMPLVANLLDIAEDIDFPESPEERTPNGFLRYLEGVQIRREGGWITLRPRHPGPAGKFRADRAAAGKGIRAIASERALSLEEAAPIVKRLGRASSVLKSRFSFVDRTGGAALQALNADEFGLTILDGLSPSARTALYGGRSLPFASLSPTLQSALRNYYLNAGAFSFLVAPERLDPQDANQDPNREATEVVGPAQVSGLLLSATVEESFAFVARNTAFPELRETLDPDIVLRYVDEEFRLRKPEELEDMIFYDRFQRIGYRSVTLRVHFPNAYYHEIQLDDYRYDPRTPFLSPAQFPASIRAYLRARRKEIERED